MEQDMRRLLSCLVYFVLFGDSAVTFSTGLVERQEERWTDDRLSIGIGLGIGVTTDPALPFGAGRMA
jgi:hypothetical protein